MSGRGIVLTPFDFLKQRQNAVSMHLTRFQQATRWIGTVCQQHFDDLLMALETRPAHCGHPAEALDIHWNARAQIALDRCHITSTGGIDIIVTSAKQAGK